LRGKFAKTAANPPAQIDTAANITGQNGNQKDWRHTTRSLLPSVALALGLMVAIWYLRRPLPPLQVTEYTRITHDGRFKNLVGTDGSRLYFTLGFISPEPIAQVAMSGGEIVPIPMALPVLSFEDVRRMGPLFSSCQ